MASLHSPPLYSSKRVMGLPTLPFTTVEDDPYIAPVLKVPAQLFVSVQTGAGHDEEKHAYTLASRSFEVIGPSGTERPTAASPRQAASRALTSNLAYRSSDPRARRRAHAR